MTGNGRFGDNTFTTAVQCIELGVLFIGIHRTGQNVAIQIARVVSLDPFTGKEGGFPHHVLASGISGGEVET